MTNSGGSCSKLSCGRLQVAIRKLCEMRLLTGISQLSRKPTRGKKSTLRPSSLDEEPREVLQLNNDPQGIFPEQSQNVPLRTESAVGRLAKEAEKKPRKKSSAGSTIEMQNLETFCASHSLALFNQTTTIRYLPSTIG